MSRFRVALTLLSLVALPFAIAAGWDAAQMVSYAVVATAVLDWAAKEMRA